MTTAEIVQKWGYPVEEFTVKTDDGYLLGLQRIPNSPKSQQASSQRIPVLLQHGLMSYSVEWVDNLPDNSLAFLLADAGYDVWMGNVRGNPSSRKHTTMNPQQKEFWNFTFHEHGTVDLPAMIDFILKITDFPRLFLIGYSLGTSEIFVLLSSKPEYNDKVKGVIALAPISVASHVKGHLRTMAKFSVTVQLTLEVLGRNEVGGQTDYLTQTSVESFYDDDPQKLACDNILFQFAGSDPAQFNVSRLPVYLNHMTGGTSLKNLKHLNQIVHTGKYAPYDFGSPELNMVAYKKESPPDYSLDKIMSPVVLMWGKNDLMSDPEDVAWLAKRLPNLYLNYPIPYKAFNHIDFKWAINAKTLLFDKVIDLLTEL